MSLNWPGYFKLTHTVQAVDQFRIFKIFRMQGWTRTVKLITTRRAAAIVFSRTRMKELSLMNMNANPVRKQLSIQTLSSLIFIKVNGPKPDEYQADY